MEDLQLERNIKLSVVIPTYNGAQSLSSLCEQIRIILDKNQVSYEIIIVDDRSIDNTWETIKKLVNHENISGIRLNRNFGQHNATCAGFTKAKGQFILTIDDDFEANPIDIPKLIDAQNISNADLVYGHFINDEKDFIRKLFKAFYRLIAKVVEGKTRVNGSSFRLLKSKLAKEISKKATHFIFIDEAILWHTENIEYVDVEHHKSVRKKSNYKLLGLFKLTGEVVLYSSILPLKLVKYLGFIIAFLNFIIGAYFVIKKLFYGVPVQGYTSLIITILLSTGIIMFVIGLIGEYLGKMYRVINNRPVFYIDEEI